MNHIINNPNLNIIQENKTNPFFIQNDLKILYLNIRSLRNKLFELEYLLELINPEERPDIIALTEIWIYKDENSKFNIKGYNPIFANRQTSKAGGVCFFVKSNIIFNEILNYDNGEFSLLGIKLIKNNLNIFIIYRSPNSNNELFYNIFDNLLSSHSKNIILGDFNYDLLNISSNTEIYTQVIETNGHTIINKVKNKFPTRQTLTSKTIIDHVITDCLQFAYKLTLSDSFISDHKVLSLSITTTNPIQRMSMINTKKVINYKHILDSKCLDPLKSLTSFDDFTHQLSCIIKTNTKVIKLNNCNKKRKIWMTTHIMLQINKRNKLYRLYVKNPFNQEILNLFKKIKIKIQHQIERAKQDHYNTFFFQNQAKPKSLWKGIHELIYNTKKVTHSAPKMLKTNNNRFQSPKLIADCFNDYFTNITDILPTNTTPTPTSLISPSIAHLTLIPPTLEQTQEIIKNLRTTSANGHDDISAKFLQEFSKELSPMINQLTTKIFTDGCFPTCLKISKVTPVFKSGDNTCPSNYRPIAVLSNLSKVAEKSIKDQLIEYLQSNTIINQNQFGFINNSSTMSACSQLISQIEHNLDKGDVVIALFIDIKKAFDCVNHQLLLRKLSQLGITGTTFNIFRSFLDNREQYVNIENENSIKRQVKSGVPQGAILSPTLFNIFINDIFTLTLHGTLQLYADDAVLVCSGSDKNLVAQEIEDDLIQIDNWFTNNKLMINTSKTKYLIFNQKRNASPDTTIKLNNKIIEKVNSFSYLGLHIDQDLKWNTHIQNIRRSLQSTAFAFRRIRSHVSENIMWLMYNAYVQPKLQYMNPLWNSASDTRINQIRRVQNKIIKIIRCLPYLTPSHLLYSINTPSFTKLSQFLTIMYIFQIKNNYIKHNFQLKPVNSIHNYNTRQSENFYILYYRTNKGLNSIISKGLRAYNEIPQNLKNEKRISVFKKELKIYLEL